MSTPVIVGFLIALITLVVVFFKPFSGLIIYIITLYVIPQMIFPALQKYRVMFTLAVIILTIFFTHKMLRHEKISLLDTRQQNLMFFLLLVVPISNISNLQFQAAWDGLNIFLTVFLLFFIIVNIADNFRRFQICCWTLVGCTTLLVVNGIIQRFRGVDLVGVLPIEGNRIRYYGHFGDPNDFALLVITFLPFLLVNIFDKETGKFRKLLLVLIAALYIMALYFTNSRGGYLAFIVILIYFAITLWGLLKGSAIGAFLFSASLVFAPSRMADISPHGQSASGRIDAWIEGLAMLKSRPVFGVGFLNFSMYHERAAHSAFVNCMAELGLVGYFVWIALLYASFTGLKALEKSETYTPYRKYARILKLSLVGFIASAFFLSQTYTPVLYMLLALITLAVYNPESSLKIPRVFSAKDFLRITAITTASIAMFKILAIVYI